LCVLVARRGVICLHEALGKLGPHGGPPLERDSIFPMMSITKSITATTLMMLVEEGLVGLTRPVQEYVPEFSGEGKELVLVHHLLTHSSGIAGDNVIQAYVEERLETTELPPPEPTEHPELHKWLLIGASAPLASVPGEEMVYANLNYELAGEIVRRLSGCSLADFAGSRVFGPLGMGDTSYVLPGDHYARTIGWSVTPRAFFDTVTPEFRDGPHPGGGVHSTAMDIAVFGQTFLNGGCYADTRILNRGTVAEMTRNQIPGVGATFEVGVYSEHHAEASWGYGWGIAGAEKWQDYPTFTRGTFSHSGGRSMMLWIDPTHDIVGVYLAICRYSPVTGGPISNVDLFVNAVTAAVED
jgi:CubicO group peptidase (beta-lactamase class C family)